MISSQVIRSFSWMKYENFFFWQKKVNYLIDFHIVTLFQHVNFSQVFENFQQISCLLLYHWSIKWPILLHRDAISMVLHPERYWIPLPVSLLFRFHNSPIGCTFYLEITLRKHLNWFHFFQYSGIAFSKFISQKRNRRGKFVLFKWSAKIYGTDKI